MSTMNHLEIYLQVFKLHSSYEQLLKLTNISLALDLICLASIICWQVKEKKIIEECCEEKQTLSAHCKSDYVGLEFLDQK